MGEEVGGYLLGELLTQGGMASVYLGKRLAPGGFAKTVVLKRLRPELQSQPALLALFLREASLLAELDHPSIVRTFDLTKLDGSYYLVMEYVHGGDLRLLLRRARRRGQRFSAAAALRLGRELLAALEYAHSHCATDGRPLGLSHRDVSPANILISVEGEVKLSDFGIAQASQVSAEPVLSAGGVRLRGKVGYMSPEQASGAQVDARADLFALAAVLYEVLTGKRLFIGQPGQPLTEIYRATIIPPSHLCPDLPAAGDAVLRKALCPRPEGRYQTAREFYEVLLDLTRHYDLWLDRLGFAEHLREVCGPEPSAWRGLDERTGTALIPSVGESDDDGNDEGTSGSHSIEHSLVEPLPASEPLSDHLITVPWPTVPGKELLAPIAHSPDDTLPVPAAELTEVGDPHRRRPKASAANQPPPGAGAGRGKSPAAAPARDSARPSIPGIDFDAVTSPAQLVDPTIPLSKASLLPPSELADSTEPPPLTTAELPLMAPPSVPAFPSSPTHPLPLLSSLPDLPPRGPELGARAFGIGLLLLVLSSLLLGLWAASVGGDRGLWNWAKARLEAP